MAETLADIEKRIKQNYPIFSGISVADKRGSAEAGQRKLEFYSREDSPTGQPLVEVFDQSMQGEELERAVLGDMLHAAPQLNEDYAELRRILKDRRTPEQISVDKQAYEIAKQRYGEKRPFEKWMNVSRLDAFIRGYAVKQWDEGYYTEEQKNIIDLMMDTIKPSGKRQSMMSK